VVEYLPRHPKVKGSSPPAAEAPGEAKWQKFDRNVGNKFRGASRLISSKIPKLFPNEIAEKQVAPLPGMEDS